MSMSSEDNPEVSAKVQEIAKIAYENERFDFLQGFLIGVATLSPPSNKAELDKFLSDYISVGLAQGRKLSQGQQEIMRVIGVTTEQIKEALQNGGIK